MVDLQSSDLSSAALDADAWQSITPLQPVEQLRQNGPNIYVKGEGVRLTDYNGKIFLDMMTRTPAPTRSATATRRSPKAVYDQLRNLHYVGTVANFAEPTMRLASQDRGAGARRLGTRLFVSGGSEAVESALKLAKQYQIQSGKQAPGLQDHLALERLSRRDHGRDGAYRLARHPPHLRSGRARLLASSPAP